MSLEEQELWEAISEQDKEQVTLDMLFHGVALPLFAEWFSGDLRCASGEVVNYVHGGYESTYENELMIEVKNGIVMSDSAVLGRKSNRL